MARHKALFVLFPALFCLMFAVAACPSNEAEIDCGPCPEGQVCDTKTGDCVPKAPNGGNGPDNGGGNGPGQPEFCGSDFDDCPEGQVCDLSTGECVDGHPCNPAQESIPSNNDCNWPEAGIGCGGSKFEDCVCDPADNVCRRRREMCEPCSRDEECGNDANAFDHPADCVEFEGERACLQRASRLGCPPGYKQQDEHCVPSEGACEDIFACQSDADCPEERPLCHRTTGTCRAGCSYDFFSGDSIGCPPEQVCHGDGRCRAQCEDHDACREIHESFVCYEEPYGFSRCRIEGCLHDVECPVPDGPEYAGFCDLRDNECYDDRCMQEDFEGRLHDDPNRHCKDGHACREGGYCEQMGCIERSHPNIACGPHQFCCTFCRNVEDNQARDECDPTPCPPSFETPEHSVEGCFMADKSKWCQACSEDDQCTGIQNPKADPRDQNACMNDFCRLTCETELDCPTRWQCQAMLRGCEDHSDCSPGQCLPFDPDDPDSPKVCMCESNGSGSDSLCPSETRCLRSGSKWMCGTGMFCSEPRASDEDPGFCG